MGSLSIPICSLHAGVRQYVPPLFRFDDSRLILRLQPKTFSAGQQIPASIVMHHRDGHYAIDADKSMDASSDTNILASLVSLPSPPLDSVLVLTRRYVVGTSNGEAIDDGCGDVFSIPQKVG